MLLGLPASCPELMPVPESATVAAVEIDAEFVFLPPELCVLTIMDALPLSAPVKGGAKVMANVTLCPPARVIGQITPLTINPVPESEIWLTVILGPPEFVNVTDCVWLLPRATLPKLTMEGLTNNCPVPACAVS